MSTQTDFDKQLDDILLRHGAEQGELHHSLKEAIKAAVYMYVLPKVKHTLAEIQDLNKNLDSTSQKHWYSYSEGYIKAVDESRLALWGDK